MTEEAGWGVEQWGADPWGSPDGEAPPSRTEIEKRAGVVQSPGVYPFEKEKDDGV